MADDFHHNLHISIGFGREIAQPTIGIAIVKVKGNGERSLTSLDISQNNSIGADQIATSSLIFKNLTAILTVLWPLDAVPLYFVR